MSTMTTSQDQAFDASVYDLPIPSQDGHKADRLTVTFTGSCELDRTNADDLEFLESLQLGRETNLAITASVTRKGFTLSPGKEDAPETTGYGVGLRVHTFEVAG